MLTARTHDTLAIYGGLTLAAAVLAFLAFDDITTDSSATAFAVEYGGLLVCAVWCLVLAGRLLMIRSSALGIVSILMLAAAIWGQTGFGPGTVPSWQPEYVATVAALAWFLLLGGALVIRGLAVHQTRKSRSG